MGCEIDRALNFLGEMIYDLKLFAEKDSKKHSVIILSISLKHITNLTLIEQIAY